MKTFLLLACVAFLLPSTVQAKDRLLFSSPNKQWALRMGTAAGEGESVPMSIVEAKSLTDLVTFGELAAALLPRAKVVWSADSKRLAYYHPLRRGGACDVYFLVDGVWTEVKLPPLPEPPDAPIKNGELAEETPVADDVNPLRWQKDGALVLTRAREDISAGKTYRCEVVATVTWPDGKEAKVGTVKKSVRKL